MNKISPCNTENMLDIQMRSALTSDKTVKELSEEQFYDKNSSRTVLEPALLTVLAEPALLVELLS